jgi:4-amino-4-deoxy-L-arabinose transferase-like glycosyltransferase
MTAAVRHAEPTTTEPAVEGKPTRRSRYALIGICALGTVLYGWALWSHGWGNSFYTAAVKSMSLNVKNFLFGSFDPAGIVTVDKPPLSLWPQVISTWIFGYHNWSILLPQVIEGVATIFLLHRTVRMWAGEHAALIAALVLALTPITVVTNRTNNTDTMLVLTLVAAAYAFTRAIHADSSRSRTKWLLGAAFLIGCGFLAKMLAAWIVAPAFLAAYLAGSTAPWRRRLTDLGGAAVVMLASSLWWVALVDLWPGDKPYIGGSTDDSALDLIIGYNGIGRVFGGDGNRGGGGGFPSGLPSGELPGGFGGPGGAGAPGGPGSGSGGGFAGGFGGGSMFGGAAGPDRMFASAVGGQISWLLPLTLIALVVAGVVGFRRFRRFAPANSSGRAGWVLWGGWLLLNALIFSFQAGIFHPYYTTMLAPAIGALVGAGGVLVVRIYREKHGYGWLVLPASVAVTGLWAWILISRDTAWNGWLRYVVAAVTVVAVVVLVLRKVRRTAIVTALVATLLAPAVWSAAGAFASTANAGIPTAGPSGERGPGGGRQLPPGASPAPGGTPSQPGPGGGLGGFGGAGGFGGDQDNATLTTDEQKILDYAKAHASGAQIVLAIEGGSQAAANYIMATDETVVGMGGFGGGDPAPSATQLATWVREGKLRFILEGTGRGGRGAGGGRGGAAASGGAVGGAPQPGQGGDFPGGDASNGSSQDGGFGRGAATERTTWVEQNCKSVLTVSTQTLYECTDG